MSLPREEKEQTLRDQLKLWRENEHRIDSVKLQIQRLEDEQRSREHKSKVIVETIGKLAFFPGPPTEETQVLFVDGISIYSVECTPASATITGGGAAISATEYRVSEALGIRV